MTAEQRSKNIRVEIEIMGRALTSAVRTPSGDLMTVGQCPRDFCNDWNLVYVMETRLHEMNVRTDYIDHAGNTFAAPLHIAWCYRHPPSPEHCVDAALRALDSVKAGAA